MRCLSDEYGLVALGLAAPTVNPFSDLRACGADERGRARRHAHGSRSVLGVLKSIRVEVVNFWGAPRAKRLLDEEPQQLEQLRGVAEFPALEQPFELLANDVGR